jgi:Ankyrin repeats (3 copies)
MSNQCEAWIVKAIEHGDVDTLQKRKDEIKAVVNEQCVSLPNYYDKADDKTLLMLAAHCDRAEVVKLLLTSEFGADVNGCNGRNETALHFAQSDGVARLLVGAGASIWSESGPLFRAVCWVDNDRVRTLLALPLPSDVSLDDASELLYEAVGHLQERFAPPGFCTPTDDEQQVQELVASWIEHREQEEEEEEKKKKKKKLRLIK